VALLKVGVRAENWIEAITVAGELLVEVGHVKPSYVASMIRVVEELGPYIVLIDGVALAHAAPGDEVLSNSISLAILEQSVDFGSGKLVKAVFALAATDHNSHIEALGALAELLADEQNRNTLLNGGNSTQIEHLLQGILGE
jgi:mannitol/fructose-specific phosphotransferase system IIA component (Ntr-type)